jgi:hypothetical protein
MSFRIMVLAVIAALAPAANTHGQGTEPGVCLSAAEASLAEQVNDYRVENGLDPVPLSRTLVTVAQYHAQDALDNGPVIFAGPCNLHSWSETRPDLWTGMCYTADHAQANLMWSKPNEISKGAFSAHGFENAAAGYRTVTGALNGWKSSQGHNDVILNQGIWGGLRWGAMGVGVIEGAYYFLWFSQGVDQEPALPDCAVPIFENGFENGSESGSES